MLKLKAMGFRCVLPPFKARQVHGIGADGKILTEPLGCLACLYSQVGEPSRLHCKLRVYLHVSCPGHCSPAWHPVWHLSLCMSLIIIPPQQGVPTCLSIRGEQSWKTVKTLCNITEFCTWELTSCYGNSLSDPVSRLWEH